MPETNLFEELKSALAEFKEFLSDNIETIRPAIQAVAGLIPQVNTLIDQLASLLESLKTEINKLDVGNIGGLGKVAELTSKLPALLTAAKNLLPDAADEIEAVEDIASVVTSLPSLDAVKAEIIALLTDIIGLVNSLKAA